MSVGFDDSTWDYWVQIEYWNSTEAIFILDGIVPSKWTLNRYGYHPAGPFLSEPDFETIRGLIYRKFGHAKIDPKDCLEWAEETGFSLDPGLVTAAIRCEKLKQRQEASDAVESALGSGRGSKFAEMRNQILSAALELLSKPPEGFKLRHESDGRINITQLKNALVDHGHDLVWKNGKRIGPDMIYETLQRAIKPDPSVKTGD